MTDKFIKQNASFNIDKEKEYFVPEIEVVKRSYFTG